VIFFSVHNPVNINMAGSAGYGSSDPSIPNILCFSATYPEGERYPETRGRHFKGRNRRDAGQEEGGTHVFYSDFSGHGTETSK